MTSYLDDAMGLYIVFFQKKDIPKIKTDIDTKIIYKTYYIDTTWAWRPSYSLGNVVKDLHEEFKEDFIPKLLLKFNTDISKKKFH